MLPLVPSQGSSRPLHRTIPLLLLALATLSPLPVAADETGSTWESRALLKRSNTVTTPATLSGQTFDYVIVGAGTAGLVLAARLSADSSITVAVIEAGGDGAPVIDQILAPADAYFNGIATMTSPYDWHYQTTAQTSLAGRNIYWPRGKVVGGSSAVNGAYMTRLSQIEQDSWASLQPTGTSSRWSWNSVYPFMKKSETWTAPTDANIALAEMVTTPSYHGTSGPIHYSYPGFFYPQVAAWVPTFANLGVGTRDPAGGSTWGAYIVTSCIDPTQGYSRSYSKTGYLDPAASRTNLVVLTGYQATKIVFSGTAATGVSFAATAGGTSYTVNARKEVILSAGVIGSPQLLQVSGVGDKALLTPLGIPVVVDLPGVGMHLTDHLSGSIVYQTSAEITGDLYQSNATYAAEQLALWKEGDPVSILNSPNDPIAYVNLTTLFGAGPAATLLAQIQAEKSSQVTAYSSNQFIQAGYNATYSAELKDIFSSPIGQAEILMANTGSYGQFPAAGNTISIQAAIQHPLSRGSVKITTTSTFDAPLIDPGYLNHPADIQILREAFKFARTVGQTAPLSSIMIAELAPGPSVSTDAQWEEWIRGVVSTEYHPASSCSMMPLALGGVVDEEMRVYGTQNLRIIDSSIVPVGLSAHMTAPLYGFAENAYDIMVNPASLVVTSTTSSSASSSSSSSTSTSTSARGSSTSAASSTSSSASSTSTPRTAGSSLSVKSNLIWTSVASFVVILGLNLVH